ncbi:MAG: molybdopterin-dependent oxidoreductase, partial [Nitrospirae bacterium]|nr:molybdopterin-dependent oxidoreductase [Nitrospirota bacterium]
DEALDFIAGKLKAAKDKYGPQSIVLGDRGGPMAEFQRTFLFGIGSPNYFNHHASCSNSVHNAHMSIAGHARNTVGYDYKNCKYMVVYGRNLLESHGTAEAKNVIDMIESGGKMVFIDVRWNLTAAKAYKFFIIRPGADYALNLALINVVINERLYDSDFVNNLTVGFDKLHQFVLPYTPEWAEKETGIPAKEIVKIAHEAAEAKPSVLFHPGWMTAWTNQDFYLRRTIYTLSGLLGNYESKGGMFISKGPGDAGVKIKTPLKTVEKPKGERFDGCGTKYPHLGAGWGLSQLLPEAILKEKPYPIKAFICMRYDPLNSMPDPEAYAKGLKKLDLLVSIDVNYSEISKYADVILPESTYLERTDYVYPRKGLKPALGLRRKAVEPRWDSKSRLEIFKALADRMGVGNIFPYNTAEECIAWQLEGTNIKLEDFDKKGVVGVAKDPIWISRKDLKFNTPSGKVEFISEKLEKAGIPSYAPYESPVEPPEGSFKLITGKVAVHTQGRTTANNPLLNEIVSENHLYIHTAAAKKLGITEGAMVEVSANGSSQKIKAKVTDLIHPEAVYMLHGFGDSIALRTRSYGKGVKDAALMKGLLKVAVGGNCPVTECVVTVKKA